MKRGRLAAALGVGLVALPVAQMIAAALSRAKPRADCAVVLGARVRDDGTPSPALCDRVDEGIRLLRSGRVAWLVMSGGRATSTRPSEAEIMRRRALDAGVPDDRILIDDESHNTAATARNVTRLMSERGLATALLVTHYFHEPRSRALFRREGARVEVAPVKMTRRLALEPWWVLREVIGYWGVMLRVGA
jgi:uncharacterized SAM-binding protein YcdF (DUF218 family)